MLYLSLPSQTLDIITIEQGLVGSVSGQFDLSGLSGNGGLVSRVRQHYKVAMSALCHKLLATYTAVTLDVARA